MSLQTASQKQHVQIREGLFTEPLTPVEKVKLMGSKCKGDDQGWYVMV